MENISYQISGWLTSSGTSLLDMLPSGSGICRVVQVEPAQYWTGYVSTIEGSFKLANESGNWYGTTFSVSEAETRAKRTPIYEYSRLRQDTPVWNMHKLPEPFLAAFFADADLVTGKYANSQFVIECLQALESNNGVSGVYFPSRRTEGSVVILNPQLVGIDIIYTGQSPPTAEGASQFLAGGCKLAP